MTANSTDSETAIVSSTTAEPSPSTQAARHADCYSAGERAGMERYQGFKQRWLGPLLSGLDRLGVTPDGITGLSLILGFAFCPLYLLGDFTSTAGFAWIVAAWGMLLAHVVIDGIDGPLARYQQVAGPRGSFTDTLADQVALAASTLTFIAAEPLGLPGLGLFAGGTYLFLYTLVVAFAMVRNALNVPYRFLLRPRYWVVVFLFIECFVWRSPTMSFITETLVWGFNVMLAWHVWEGFLAIRQKI